VYELRTGSAYLSKTLRAVKSLNYAMTHLFLLSREMWDPRAMPPRSTPCLHPAVPGARPQQCTWTRCCICQVPAQHEGLLPGSGRGNLDWEYLGNRSINLGSFSFLSPWSYRELLMTPVQMNRKH